MKIGEGAGLKELYDSEKKALREIAYALRIKHSFKGVKTIEQEETVKKAFDIEARNRCAEIGLVIDVLWTWDDEKTGQSSPDVSSDPGDHNLYWLPKIVITGRTDKLPEYDHNQQQWEVRKGLLDGIEGVVDINTGKLREPKRKDIF